MDKNNTIIYFDMDGTINNWELDGNPHEEHYFLYREPFNNVLNAIRLLKMAGFNVAFATAAFETGNAKNDKLKWLKNNGMDDIPVIFIPYGKNKDDYLEKSKTKILVDDHTPNLVNFSGIGIKMINRDNHKTGIWKGPTIKFDDSSDKIAFEILRQISYKQLEENIG